MKVWCPLLTSDITSREDISSYLSKPALFLSINVATSSAKSFLRRPNQTGSRHSRDANKGIASRLVASRLLSAIILLVLLALPVLVVLVLAYRDAKRKEQGLVKVDDDLLKMFNMSLEYAKRKAHYLQINNHWQSDWQRIVGEIIGIDPNHLADKDIKSKREQNKLAEEISTMAPNKEAIVDIYSTIAYAMQNKGYSSHAELTSSRKYRRLQKRVDGAKNNPSMVINKAINKCLNYIRILSHHYIFNLMMLESQRDTGEIAMAGYRKFVSEQENNTGDMSEALVELRKAVNNFVRGDKDA